MIPVGSEVYANPTSISQPLYFINMYTFHWKENMKRMLPLTRPVQENGMSLCRVLTIEYVCRICSCSILVNLNYWPSLPMQCGGFFWAHF